MNVCKDEAFAKQEMTCECLDCSKKRLTRMNKINLNDRYKFRLSNGDWLSDILENHLDLMRVNGLDLIGCLRTGRLVKECNHFKTQCERE